MAEERTINLNVNTEGAQKEVKNLEKAVEGVNEEVKETSASTEQMGSALDNATGGAITKFKGLKSGLKGVITSFKSLRVAIIATGIGALLIAVTSLGQAFTRSEEGQNKFAKILGVIGSVVGNLLDLLADLGENIISVFESPKQAVEDFAKLIKENIVNRFEGLLELVPKLGRAVSLLFKGEFKEAGKVAVDAVGKVTLGVDSITDSVDNAIEKVKEFGAEVSKDAKNAARIADLRAEADRLDRKLIVDRAKADRDRATLLEKSVNKEKFTVQERIGFLQEAADLEEKITNQEIEAAAKRLEAQQAENALGKSTKEDKEKEAQLEAQLIQLETAKLTKQKEVTSQIIAFKAEEAAALKAIADQQAAEDKEREDLKAAQDKERKDKEEQENKDRNQRIIEEEKAVAEAEIAIKNASMDAATFAFSLLASTDKKNKKLQAAMLIATNAVGIAQNIINTNAANARLTLEAGLAAPPLILANKIRMFTGIAASVAATAKGLSALKTGGSASGGGGASAAGGGGETQPPSFNIVGATETSQLAGAIGSQTQQPVQAFVVANDVTTAQSLENNIVEGATL
tara:strand:+ start:1174 stop:2895 length:1722 start_codon:yes stop_codon:yes gene_type:complete